MNAFKFAVVGAALSLITTMAHASTLDEVKARGELNCVVTTGLAGFAAPDADGRWEGFRCHLLPRGCRCGGRRR